MTFFITNMIKGQLRKRLLSHGYDFVTAAQRLSQNIGYLSLIILSFSSLCHVIEVIIK